uniref:Uncharacterized protein n=1 Tax=Glossina pallidipes TaxID=7398 RepID=A0A1B0ACZ7_GLOPL
MNMMNMEPTETAERLVVSTILLLCAIVRQEKTFSKKCNIHQQGMEGRMEGGGFTHQLTWFGTAFIFNAVAVAVAVAVAFIREKGHCQLVESEKVTIKTNLFDLSYHYKSIRV